MRTPTSTISTQGDLGGHKIKMTLDENSLTHLMNIYIDMYSDRELAVIREYSVNSRDAHIEAGNSDPINIITPTKLSPYFKVIDRGVGLSISDLEDMYSKYGASSKRGTDTQTGMLGIGSKSALTLVPQFTITSTKGGVQIKVSVSRDADGTGTLEVIDSRATDEPNGVEISIPVPNTVTFNQKVEEFFKFWEPGTVLVNGQEPKHLTGLKVGDKFIVSKGLNQDYVVMGGVAYPVKEGLLKTNYYYSHLGIVAFVDIGEVHFTPSREDLSYTPTTKATIARLRQEFFDGLVAAAQKAVDAADSHSAAWQVATEWRQTFRSVLGSQIFTYRDAQVPLSLDTPGDVTWRSFDVFSTRLGKHQYYSVHALTPDQEDDTLFVTGFAESLRVSPTQRAKFQKYLENEGLSLKRVAITSEKQAPNDTPWTKDFHVAEWEQINKIKVPRQAVNSTGPRKWHNEKYELADGRTVNDLDTEQEIIYYSSTDAISKFTARKIFPDAQIVILSKNRWVKFVRDWPTAKHYNEAMRGLQDKLKAEVTEADRVKWHYNRPGWLGSITIGNVKDPDLRKFLEDISSPFSAAAERYGHLVNRYEAQQLDKPDYPIDNYPMLASNGISYLVPGEHIEWYINTWYTTNLKKES